MSGTVLTVSDANVLIDIEDGGLTSSMFSLASTNFCVPDVLFDQELRKNHSHLLDLGLNLLTLSGESVGKVFSLAQKHGKVSRLDLFALQLAREKSALLLTGDRALCNVAAKYQIECHGTIWLVERMVQQKVIHTTVAKNAYERMRGAGSRLPWEDAERRLKEMKGDDGERGRWCIVHNSCATSAKMLLFHCSL